MLHLRLTPGLLALAAGMLMCAGGAGMTAQAAPLTLYVSPKGKDTWSGRLAAPNKAGTDGPLATLEGARDAIRRMKAGGGLPAGGATVEVEAGTYELRQPLELTAGDTGSRSAPITYEAKPGAKVRLSGGRQVTGWRKVTDKAVLSQLEPAARGKVYQADLRAQGITDLGSVTQNRPELIYNDKPMTLARWPNKGFAKIVDVVDKDGHEIHGIKGSSIGKFTYSGDRPSRWVGEKDLWLEGFWFWDWSDDREKVASIDTAKHIITLEKPYSGYGYRAGQWWYAFNCLSELDSPGEWYIDRDKGILYFYPPSPLEHGTAVLTMLPAVVTMKGLSYVTLRGFTIEAVRGVPVSMDNCSRCTLVKSVVRNCGEYAVHIGGGDHDSVIGCDIYNCGAGGVDMSGGDRKTLTPAGHLVSNCHIHNWGQWKKMYSAAVVCNGVGNRVTHNLMDNAPHIAILFGGNNHVFEYNEIHSVCMEANDAGAIYAGRNWTMRGTIIRYNYLHNIHGFEGKGCVGVYLDDMYCGTKIYGNLFYEVTRAAFIGGGRDNSIENNIFVDCTPAVHVDARGMGWAAGSVPTTMMDRLKAMPYQDPLWSARYPKLVNILEDHPAEPRGDVIERNICWGGQWGEIEGKARPMLTMKDNLIDKDPDFVDAAKGDYQLKANSPAWALGFQRLPLDRIGVYRSADRASWPVTSVVHDTRPAGSAPTKAAQATPPPVLKIKPAAAVTIDGMLEPGEWDGAPRSGGIAIAQGVNGEKMSPPSRAWVAYDDHALVPALLVAVDNEMPAGVRPTMGDKWGQDDAVEVAISDPSRGENASILVLRGYPNGHFESSGEAGAPAAAVKRAAEGVKYAAKVPGPGRWVCEWRIPWASLGIDPAKSRKLDFNVSVRKTAPKPMWLMWHGTGSWTWDVSKAGVIELAR